MPLELRVPELADSISEAQVGEWLKQPGEAVDKDEVVVLLETDKTALEVASEQAGVLDKIVKPEGEIVTPGDVLGVIGEGEGKPAPAAASGGDSKPASEPKPADDAPAQQKDGGADDVVMPAARKLAEQEGVDLASVAGSGPGGRVLKEDVQRKLDEAKSAPPATAPSSPTTTHSPAVEELTTVKPMTMMRRTVARRLVEAQQTAALLTTFNEVDMKPVMDLRAKYKDAFQKRYDVKLGFMSFFVKAVIEALKECPELNAEIRGNDIVYRNYYDIGVAIGGGKGLLVPILRRAERMSFAEVEKTIYDFAIRAKDGKVQPNEMQGGTFTITNGGVYGSLLSTPIINGHQSGILGMHAIKERAVVVGGQVVARPMMYLALTYDHRIVDGREAVTFLVRIKEILEEPARMLLEV